MAEGRLKNNFTATVVAQTLLSAAPRVLTGVSSNKKTGVMGDSACARPVDGLFLPSDCTRMAVAVKPETDKSNLVNVLDGSGPRRRAAAKGRPHGQQHVKPLIGQLGYQW